MSYGRCYSCYCSHLALEIIGEPQTIMVNIIMFPMKVAICSASGRSTPLRNSQVRGEPMAVAPHLGFGQEKVGLSENSVPLNPMVNDHYPY